MKIIWRTLNAFMGGLFLFAAVLQFNDENALRWIALYAAAAIPCVQAVIGRGRFAVPAVIAAVSLLWATVYAAQGAWSVPPGEMFAEWEMKSNQVRETREMFGLLIVGAWMVVVAVAHRAAQSKT